MFFKFFILFAVVNVLGANIIEKYIFPKLPNYVENSKSEVCNFQSELYKNHLENYTFWAHEMLDSSAKYTHGLLRGNTYELGNYYQCISIEAPFTTQYCVAQVTAHVPTLNPSRDPLSIYYDPYESVFNRVHETYDQSQISRHSVKFGLCLPASCSSQDLEDYLNRYVSNESIENVTYSVQVPTNLCERQDYKKSFDSWDILFCFIALVIFALVISATVLDYMEESNRLIISNKKSNLLQLLRTFSARKNFNDLIKSNNNNSPLAVLNGMRTFSIFVIIIMHRFAFLIPGPLMNFDYIEKEYRTKYAAFLFHSDLFVDSFFMFSGILVAYLLLIHKNTNPFLVIAMRYLRLTPAYAFVILYYASIFYYTGSGPFWNSIVGGEMKDCRQNWWTSLLYINNYVNPEHMCIGQTWYLPCDFHFFIIGVIVMMTIKKSKRVGLTLLGALLIISIIIPFAVTTLNEEAPMLYFYRNFLQAPKSYPYFKTMYIKSHIRATPYIVGLITGYIYYQFRENPVKLSRFSSYALANISVITITICLLSGSVFYDSYHQYNAVEAGAYAALHRLPWTIGTACLMISVSYGRATILRTFLSWPVWAPFAKLSYAAYLLHMQFPLRQYAGTASSGFLSYFNVTHLGLGDITLTFVISLLLYLGIEAPIQLMFKMFLTPTKEPTKNQNVFVKVQDNQDSLISTDSHL